jgi:4a-hydroxytetrahydrobiopterin dehydratase
VVSGALCGGKSGPTGDEAAGEPTELAALAWSMGGRTAPPLRLLELPLHVLHCNQTHRVGERIHLPSPFRKGKQNYTDSFVIHRTPPPQLLFPRSSAEQEGFEEDRQMEALREMRCVACRREAPTVTEAEIAELHPQVSEWEIVEQQGIKKLSRVFRFDDFAKALALTNALGEIAEEEGHHPTLLTEWGRTTVTWWTHKIRGLHRNDFIMAAKADELYRRMSV